MLDVEQYNLAEQLARTGQSHYWYAAPHSLGAFQEFGFPTRVKSFAEIYGLVDAFHEGTFDRYMLEMGGLSPKELERLIDALVTNVKMQLHLFTNRPPIIPINTMLAMSNLYRKMLAFKKDFKTVLEIGPGCGYSSIFLSQHMPLTSYVQIEVCQSLYLLQSAVNQHAFGLQAKEHAALDLTNTGNYYGFSIAGDIGQIPEPKYAVIPKTNPINEHFPWWKIGDVAERPSSFDIVTSNANLNEFSSTALKVYLNLLNKVMKDDGLFLVQCSGADLTGRRPQLQKILMQHKLAVVQYASTGTPFARSEVMNKMRCFAKESILVVKEGHPAFERFYGKRLDDFEHLGDEEFIFQMFFQDSGDRSVVTPEEITSMVNQKIAETGI